MFSSSILHYIIWYDKCYLLIHLIVEIHLLNTSMSYRWVHQSPHPLVDLMMNSCFVTRFHSSFPENLRCHLVNLCCTFLLRHRESELSCHLSELNLGQLWWLEHFSKSYNTGLLWPGKVMACPAYLARWPVDIVSLLARLSILPWGNCKTYSTSCSWWILCVSKVWPLLEDHVNAISKHVCGTPIFNKNSWSNATFSLSNIQNTVVWVMSWTSSLLT